MPSLRSLAQIAVHIPRRARGTGMATSRRERCLARHRPRGIVSVGQLARCGSWVESRLRVPPRVKRVNALLTLPLAGRLPYEVADDNLALTARVLRGAGLSPLLLRGMSPVAHAIAVDVRHRGAVLRALTATREEGPITVQSVRQQRLIGPALLARWARHSRIVRATDVLRAGQAFATSDGSFVTDLRYGCDIEFWEGLDSAGPSDLVYAPRPNVASDVLTGADVQPVPVIVTQVEHALPRVFSHTFLEEVKFDIDAVYTWVDGVIPPGARACCRRGSMKAIRGTARPTASHDS